MTTTERLEILTQKWWFYLIAIVLFFLPSYSLLPFDPGKTSELIAAVLSKPLIYSIPELMPFFKLIPALLILVLFIWGDKLTRLFDMYAAITIFIFALLQNMAVTQAFGFAVLTGNVIVYSLVALTWFWEARIKATVLTFRRLPIWRYWVVPVAFLAFWFPVNAETLGPDLSLPQLLSNSAGLTLCMMLPVYLAILTLCHPAINRNVLRITSFAGIVTAGLNVLQWFFLAYQPWMGIMHLPLLTISLYGLILSGKREPMPGVGHHT